jgi:hypothetical protein
MRLPANGRRHDMCGRAEIRMQAFVFAKFPNIDMFHTFHTKKEYNAFHLW